MPAGASTAFTSDKSSGTRWIAPVLLGIVAIGLIVVVVLLFSNSEKPADPKDNPGGTEQTTTTTTPGRSVPSIKVGEGSGGGTTPSGR